MKDWQAAIVGYIAMLLVAETEAAPLAVVMSWGIAVFMLIDQVGSGGATLSTLTNSLRAGIATSTPNTSATPSAEPSQLPQTVGSGQ